MSTDDHPPAHPGAHDTAPPPEPAGTTEALACDDRARDHAAAESLRLLDVFWAVWCRDRDVEPVPAPTSSPPVLYRVGLEPDPYTWVALVRFDVVVHGRRLHGLVRGPADVAVFSVHPGASPQQDPGGRRGLGRVRAGHDDTGRHRRFGVG